MFSLAPNAMSIGSAKSSSSAVRISETMACSVKQLPSVFSALSGSPLPMKMDARGAPPAPMSAANAETNRMMGMHTPTPVSARLPEPGMWPM